MILIHPPTIALVFSTYYPKWYKGKLQSIKHTDKVRGDLALQSVKYAHENGYRVVVIDGKSAKTFYRELVKFPETILRKRLGEKRSSVKRQGIKIAAGIPGVKVIILTEPEKLSFIRDCLFATIQPIVENTADIVVPKREETLFKSSYPTYMYDSEKEGNALYNETLRANGLLDNHGEDLDLFFGPRAFLNTPAIRKLFLKKYQITTANLSFPAEYFDTEQYSNTLFFPVVEALKKNLRVTSVTVPFSYPFQQKKNEEKGLRELFLEKRKSQRLGILVELLHFISYLEKNKFSRVTQIKRK